jgi:hypothetical protein
MVGLTLYQASWFMPTAVFLSISLWPMSTSRQQMWLDDWKGVHRSALTINEFKVKTRSSGKNCSRTCFDTTRTAKKVMRSAVESGDFSAGRPEAI